MMTTDNVSYYNITKTEDAIDMNTQMYIAIYLCVMMVVGVCGNVMTITVILTNKRLQTVPNAYITNLAVADILLLSVNLPSTIMEFITQKGQVAGYNYYCKYTSAINILTMICALTSVSAVSLNRYLHLCLAKDVYKKYTSKGFIAGSIFIIWFWSFLITLPPYFGYGEFGYHEKFHTCFFPAYDEQSWVYGTIFCCVLGVFPPVIACSFFYTKILLMLRKHHKNIMQHYSKNVTSSKSVLAISSKPLSLVKVDSTKDPVSLDSHKQLKTSSRISAMLTSKPRISKSENQYEEDASSMSVQELNKAAKPIRKMKGKPVWAVAVHNHQQKLIKRNRRQQRSIFMLIAIFIIILVCWMPISVSFIVDKTNGLPSIVYLLFVVLAWTNSSVNVFIYAYMNLQFRAGYAKLLKCHIWKRKCNSKAVPQNDTEEKLATSITSRET